MEIMPCKGHDIFMNSYTIAFYDIDGCLLDSSHRHRALPDRQIIDLAHWQENEKYAHRDQVIPDMLARLHRDQNDPNVITAISTNRYICDHTLAMFNQHGIIPDFISARQNDDQKSAELKQHFMHDLMLELNIIKAVFYDDNVRILKDVKKHFSNLKQSITVIYKPSKQGF